MSDQTMSGPAMSDRTMSRTYQGDDVAVPHVTGVIVEGEAQGGDFATRLADAARDNPVSAALIAMGAVWLLASATGISAPDKDRERKRRGRRGRRRDRGRYDESRYGYPSYGYDGGYPMGPQSMGIDPDAAAYVGARFGADGIERGAEGMGEAAQQAGAAVGQAARSTGQTVARAGETAARAVSQAGEGVAEAASSVGHGLSDAAQASYRGAALATRTAGDTVSRASQVAMREGAEFGRAAREFLEDRPLAIGALGLAAGAGLAFALPRTQAEAEWFGETSESFKSEARRTVSERIDEARRTADDLAQRAMRDAQAHGLSQDSIAGALQEFKAKLEKTALAAKDAAEEEFSGRADAKADQGSKPGQR